MMAQFSLSIPVSHGKLGSEQANATAGLPDLFTFLFFNWSEPAASLRWAQDVLQWQRWTPKANPPG